MPFRIYLLLPFLLSFTGILAHQHTTIQDHFSSDPLNFNGKPRLIGGFGTRNTFIHGFGAPIFNIRAGVEFNGKLRIGAGFCFLKKPKWDPTEDQSPFVYLKPVVNDQNANDTVPSFLSLTYFSYFAEYIYFNRKKWQFSLPVQLGFGQFYYQYELNGGKIRELENPVFLYEPSVSVQYKLLRWLALGADVGYRFMLVDKKLGNTQYNSPIYDLKLTILWGEIYRALFPEGHISKRRGK